MNSTCLSIFISALAMACGSVFAQNLPDQFTVEGRLYSSGVALGGTVDIKFEVIDSSNTSCVLFREVHSGVDLGSVAATQGIFALKLGAGTTQLFRPARLSAVFANGVLQSGDSNGDNAADAGCSFTPAPGSQRLVKMYVSDGGGPWTYLGPDTAITTSPTAMVAETLQGRDLNGFILADSTVAHMNQTDIATIFNSTNYVKLTDLLNGNSGQYMPSSPAAAVSFNSQRITNLANPTAASDAATKNYADDNIGGKSADTSSVSASAGDGYVLAWDKGANKWKAVAPGDSSRLALTGGMMTGTINFNGGIGTGINLNGNDLLATGHITMSPLKTLTFGNLTTSQETSLTGSLSAANAGATWYNSTDKALKFWNGTSAAAPVMSVNGKPGPSITLNPNDLGLGTAALVNVGTAAGEIPQLDVGGKIPAALLPATKYSDLASGTGVYMNYMPNGTACGNNEVLKWDTTNTRWICAVDNDSFSGTAAGGDLTGTFPNPTIGALKVDNTKIADGAISTPKLFTNPGSNRLVATDSTGGATLSPFSCSTVGEILRWNATNGWECASISTALGSSYIVDGGNTRGAAISIGTNDIQNLELRVNGTPALTLKTTGAVSTGSASATATKAFAVNLGSASGLGAFASGNSTATAMYSTAIGSNNSAINDGTFATGQLSQASGLYSSALGQNLVANSFAEVVVGSYNLSSGASTTAWVATDPLFVVGNGQSTGSESNALTILKNGNVGIGTTNPVRSLDVGGGIRLQPSGLPTTPGAGDIILDSSSGNAMKYYNGSGWQTLGTGTGDFMKDGSVAMTGSLQMGGQTIYGSNAASGNLTLDSTSNGSKGQIFVNPSGGTVNVGLTAATLPASLAAGSNGISSEGTSGTVFSAYKAYNGASPTGGVGSAYSFYGNGSVKMGSIQSTWQSSSPTDAQLSFLTLDSGALSEKMRISANGNIGIGTLAPARLLHVNGPMRMTPTTSPSIPAAGDMYIDSALSNQLRYHNGSGWIDIGSGSVTQVSAGTGLKINSGAVASGAITTTGTLNVDTGSGDGQIMTVQSGGKLPGLDGSLVTNVNAVKLQSRAVATTSPNDGEVLTWNSIGSKWQPAPIALTANSVTTTKIADDAITASKINSTNMATNRLLITDQTDPNLVTYATCLTDGQVMAWNATTGWTCQNTGTGDFKKDGTVVMTGNFNAGGNSLTSVVSISGSSALTVSAGGTNQNLDLAASGTGMTSLKSNGAVALQVQNPPSAMNYITVNGASSSSSPTINVTGTDTDIGLRINTKGNFGLGIGTAPSPYLLNLFKTSNPEIHFSDSYASNGRIGMSSTFNQISTGALAKSLVLANDAGAVHIGTGTSTSTVRVTIDTTGNVGIGTTSPSAALDVNGDVRARHLAGDVFNYDTSGGTGAGTASYGSATNTKANNLTVTGNDIAVKIQFDLTSTASSGDLVIVRFKTAFSSAPPVCVATAGSNNAATAPIFITPTLADYTISLPSGYSLIGSSTYIWYVHCLQ